MQGGGEGGKLEEEEEELQVPRNWRLISELGEVPIAALLECNQVNDGDLEPEALVAQRGSGRLVGSISEPYNAPFGFEGRQLSPNKASDANVQV